MYGIATSNAFPFLSDLLCFEEKSKIGTADLDERSVLPRSATHAIPPGESAAILPF